MGEWRRTVGRRMEKKEEEDEKVHRERGNKDKNNDKIIRSRLM